MSIITVAKGQVLQQSEGVCVAPVNGALSLRLGDTEIALIGPGFAAPTTAPYTAVALFSGDCEARTSWDVDLVVRNIVCVLRHDARSRIARRLLTLHRGCRGGWIPVTQMEMADALVLRRQTVNQELVILEKNQIIESRRGALRVVDRNGLTAIACACAEEDVPDRRFNECNGHQQITSVDPN